jgi:hypothetical protein
MTLAELQQALRDGSLGFCAPPRDAYFEPEFVKCFVRDVFGLDWEYCGFTGETRLSDFQEIDETQAILKRINRLCINRLYGVDCSDVPELNFWLCLKRCESAVELHNAQGRELENSSRSMECRIDARDGIGADVQAGPGIRTEI